MNVKKIRYIALALVVAAFCSCQKEPSTSDLHRDYLVYTAHDTGTDFAAIDTYYVPDSILVIGNSDKTEYWKDADAQEIIGTVADLMESRNFVRTDDKETAQTGLQISYVERVTYFVGYDYPYWWWYYPYYWTPGYWGDWLGWHYPYRVYYGYTAGSLLIEIVSEPDMRSADEVIAYLEKLRMICQYLGASDCKLQEGSMRADVNLSVREVGASEFGTRTEMKNLNSFKAITHAIEGERQRQIELIEEGKKVIQETRRWDDNKEYSYAMRSKEDAQDYRYFPEPDLVPIVISDEWIQKIKDQQPELRSEKLARYEKDYDIPRYDAELITGTKKMADLFEATCAICNKPKKVSNWLMVETMRLLNENGQEPADIKFSPENLAKLIELADAGTINSSVAKEVFERVFAEDVDPEKYVEDHGLKTVNDEGALRTLAEEVIAKNPKAVEDFKGGKEKALGALVGQIMKAMKGKANPGMVNELLREMLK